jgi:hypothetical protein
MKLNQTQLRKLVESISGGADIADKIAENIGNAFYEQLLMYFAREHMQQGTLDDARMNIEEAIRQEVLKLTT